MPASGSTLRTTRAVVLARGLGSRMRAADPGARLTVEQERAADTGLKPMMPVNGRPFLDYVLSGLADAGLVRVALVVAPDHRSLLARYSEEARPTRFALSFLVQAEARGTADAVLAAEEWTAGEPFLTMNADNLYPRRSLVDLAQLGEPGLAAFEPADLVKSGNIPVERINAFAIVKADESGLLTQIVEKPGPAGEATAPRWRGQDLISMNCWRFDARIFAPCRDVPRSARGEFELPEAVGLAVRRGVPFRVVRASGGVLDLSKRGDAVEVSRRLSDVAVRL
jgi:dTDP-glucose pyrophosphorylase